MAYRARVARILSLDRAIALPARFWQYCRVAAEARYITTSPPSFSYAPDRYVFFTISGQYLTKLLIVQRDAATMDAALIIIIVHHMFAQ